MRRHRNVKIVATLGPASDDYETIKELHLAGADVFRLNMSHGSHDDIAQRHQIIRKIEEELNSPIGILADLQGPKLRVGEFDNGSENLVEGQDFCLDLRPAKGTSKRVSLPHPEIFTALSAGSVLLVNDGKIKLEVKSCGEDFADCIVKAGGAISNRKGVNVPDVILPLAALSDKDRTDLEFACGLGIDWLALSFVQRPEDVMEARELAKGRAAILSKIEKPAALSRFDDILKCSDGIMVARGDLGVELPVQNVPPVQKRLVRACRAAAKPVIVATQMLESMIESPMPTRAEVSDVATAIYEGSDAIMLSGETSVGKFPIQCIKMLKKIALKTEYFRTLGYERFLNESSDWQNIALGARDLASRINADGIIIITRSGQTANVVSNTKPFRMPVHAFTNNNNTYNHLSLVGGIKPYFLKSISNKSLTIKKIKSILSSSTKSKKSLKFVLIAGIYSASHTDSIQIVST